MYQTVAMRVHSAWTPRESQRVGFERLVRDGNALLGMDMGTGKTLVAIAAMASFGGRLHLVVCPKSVANHWPGEVEKFWPEDLRAPEVLMLHGLSSKKAATAVALAVERTRAHATPLIVVINVDKFWRSEIGRELAKVRWATIVADECHRLKSPTGKASKYAGQLAQKNPEAVRIGLTGTPLPHSKLDAFGQCRFIRPELFGQSNVWFRSRYAVTHREYRNMVLKWINVEEFEAKLGEVLYRVKADDVLDLPEAVHIEKLVELSPKCRKVYEDVARDFVALVGDGIITAANALPRLLRLQQITGGNVKLDEEDELERIDTSKEEFLGEILEDLPLSEPVVVFARFTADLAAVERACTPARGHGEQRKYLELSGKRRELEEWQAASGGEVLGVQIQAGGVGVDLSRARYAVYYSRDQNLGNFLQSLARTRRPGAFVTKERTCFYIHLLARQTIDVRIARAMEKNRNGLDAVVEAAARMGAGSEPSGGSDGRSIL